MQFPRSLGALVVALGLIATSCGGSSASTVETSSAPDAAEAPAATAAPVADALVLPTVSGGQIDFASLEGQDVVLWFWAPW